MVNKSPYEGAGEDIIRIIRRENTQYKDRYSRVIVREETSFWESYIGENGSAWACIRAVVRVSWV
jgi:hypothetical protein